MTASGHTSRSWMLYSHAPEDWQNEVYVAKTLIFRDPLGYHVDEDPFLKIQAVKLANHPQIP